MELSGYEFGRVCDIDPDRTDAGVPAVVVPQPEYAKRDEKPVHDHGWGPFCAFGVPDEGTHRPGVYVLAVEDEVTYVGETQDLYAKFANGYGTISPADCFEGGGGTNCRLNTAIFHAVRAGERVSVHLHATDDFAGTDEENRALRRIIKDDLVTALNPAWNRTGGDGGRPDEQSERRAGDEATDFAENPDESRPNEPGSEREPSVEAGAESTPDSDGVDAESDPVGAATADAPSGGSSADTTEAWFETERSASGRSEGERPEPERSESNPSESERSEPDAPHSTGFDPEPSDAAPFDATASDAPSDPNALAAQGFEPKPVEPERPRDDRGASPSADRPTGEFAALYDYLVEHERDRVERSFADLEVVLEARLPTEARRWRRWWTNDEASHPHAGAWLRAGYEVTEASLPEGRVTFERVDADERSPSAESAASPAAGASPRRPE